MNIKQALSNIIFAAATIGCLMLIVSNLHYVYGIIDWGITYNWHYANVSGWGFRFLFYFYLNIIALLLISPFLLLSKIEATTNCLPNRKLINTSIVVGLLLFLLAVASEVLLNKFVP